MTTESSYCWRRCYSLSPRSLKRTDSTDAVSMRSSFCCIFINPLTSFSLTKRIYINSSVDTDNTRVLITNIMHSTTREEEKKTFSFLVTKFNSLVNRVVLASTSSTSIVL